MFRTYQNLYRLVPSLSSIGTGRYRYKLPFNLSITLDMALLALLYYFVSDLLIAPILSLFLPYPIWLMAACISVLGVVITNRFDPKGKPMYRFIVDYAKFVCRNKISDGWEKSRKPFKGKMRHTKIRLSSLEEWKDHSIMTRAAVPSRPTRNHLDRGTVPKVKRK